MAAVCSKEHRPSAVGACPERRQRPEYLVRHPADRPQRMIRPNAFLGRELGRAVTRKRSWPGKLHGTDTARVGGLPQGRVRLTDRVSFTDADGIRHATAMQAESLYEAAVFRQDGWTDVVGTAVRLEIQVLPPMVTHTSALAG